MNIVQSTFYNNRIVTSTVRQGDAIYFGTAATIWNLRSNIFDTNTGGGTDCQGSGANNGANNLEDGGVNSCNNAGAATAVTNFDPNLQHNGGTSNTHNLNSGSNAIDAAPAITCTYISTGANPLFSNGANITRDQRGAPRPYNTNCDIGAVEVQEIQSVGTCSSGLDLSGRQTFSFTQVSSNTVVITVTANSGGLKCINAEEMVADHLAAPGSASDTTWWHITGDATGFVADIELPDNASSPEICKYPGGMGGYGWDCAGTMVDNTGSVTRQRITSFSDWAVGDNPGPTAVSLQNPTTRLASQGFNLLLLILPALAVGGVTLARRQRQS